MSFKRSPSKVWWASDSTEWRENLSHSPHSQDSGFSDTETSPHLQINQEKDQENTPKKSTPAQRIPKDIFKELSSEKNLSENFKEKSTPSKAKLNTQTDRLTKSETKSPAVLKRIVEIVAPNTEPVTKQRYVKNSPKVSRNLFTRNDVTEYTQTNQYSKQRPETTESSKPGEETIDDSQSWPSDNSSGEIVSTQSLPNWTVPKNGLSHRINLSAPELLERDEGVTSFNNSLSSDCESELECLFDGSLESPKHTSTPKAGGLPKMRHRREKLPLELYLKYQQERVPPIHTDGLTVDNAAVEQWMKEARATYEPECMTTLQCKSIAGELSQKVAHLAACSTTIIRGLLSHARCIEMEYQSLNSEKKHIDPLIQSLAGNILDFLKTHALEINSKILKLYDQIRSTTQSEDALKLVSQLFNSWESVQDQILTKEVKKLVDKLEDPTSELDLRATVTGITSISLRNHDLLELFIKADIIPILLILCEKCEGSSLRSLILRALSTMCCNFTAVRQFEKFSGVQLVTDTIEEDSRPEPERSEAVALLAQVTAPWLEDNHSVKGLQDYSKRLVKSLTKFAAKTKCCQNLLLCTAALANLSSMDTKSIKYMIHMNTAKILLETVTSRGLMVSVYLLEQVSTLIANMSSIDVARKQLTDIEAPTALLYFLRSSHVGEEVEKRLQQKSIIALSRLCGGKEAARQIVEHGGVEKLVRICREKSERYNDDAVLVAALATLRKIVDACGSEVLSTQDVQELVEPKLVDSFLAYSSQNESYV